MSGKQKDAVERITNILGRDPGRGDGMTKDVLTEALEEVKKEESQRRGTLP